MPNRILKESIRESASIDSLSWFEEVLFYRLIVSCDDYGRFDGRMSVIKSRLFPLKEDLTLKAVSRAIEKLVTAGLVTLYEYEGKPYLYLPTWTAHQNVRAKRSKYPEPVTICKSLNSSENICIQMNSCDFNSHHMNANVPVIQSESLSVSESLSQSISEYDNISGDGGDTRAREATEQELLSIGLKPGEYFVTSEKVRQIISRTDELFQRHFPTRKVGAMDRRMVFILTGHLEDSGLLGYACEQAILAGKSYDWRYIAGIMRRLFARDITTEEAARRYDLFREDEE